MPNITTFALCYLPEGKRWNAEYPAKANMTFPLLAQRKYLFGRLPVSADGRIPGKHFSSQNRTCGPTELVIWPTE